MTGRERLAQGALVLLGGEWGDGLGRDRFLGEGGSFLGIEEGGGLVAELMVHVRD